MMVAHRERQSGIFRVKDYLYGTNIIPHLLIYCKWFYEKTFIKE